MTQTSLAGPEDSAELCRLMKQVPVPGTISLVYSRDPDYFAFLPAEGWMSQVAVIKEDNAIASMGVRSIRSLYVNGVPVDVGYLHGVRVLQAYRNRGHFARGALLMRALHEKDGIVRAYLATVIEDTASTRAMISYGRRNLPRVFDKGRYITYAMPLRRKRAIRRSFQSIEKGSPEKIPEIIRFLNDNGKRRQYFPEYSEQDFCKFASCGLRYEDILIHRDRGSVTAVLGVWDQNEYKQTSVYAYGGRMRYARPLVSLGLQAAGYYALPHPGEQFRVVYACFACSKDDRQPPLDLMFNYALGEWSGKGYHYMITGFHQRDPLRRAMNGRIAVPYASRVYLAAWEDGREFCSAISDQSIPYLEVALL